MPIPRSILGEDHPDMDLEVVAGAWPDDARGHFVVSTSDQRSHPVHAFFGDGLIARMPLRPGPDGRFPWRARVLDTPSVRLKRARPDLFTAGPVGTSSPWGFVNCANTAPLPWGDRLFATWDAGRPRRGRPGHAGVRRRGRAPRRLEARDGPVRAAADLDDRAPGDRPRPGLHVERQPRRPHRRRVGDPLRRDGHAGAPLGRRERGAPAVHAHDHADARLARPRRHRLQDRPR